MPQPELLVVYLIDRYVPTGTATIDFSDLAERTRDKYYRLEMDDGQLKVIVQKVPQG